MLYAVGDIHGELEKLDELIEMMSLQAGDRLVFWAITSIAVRTRPA